jgi:heterotetrameric sarcosine oxidase gamma subunit
MTVIIHSSQPVAFPLGQALSERLQLVPPYPTDAELSLAVVTGWRHLHIRGANAAEVVSAAYDVPPMGINAVAVGGGVDDAFIVRLRRDEFVLLTNDITAAMERAASKTGDSLLTLTDISHGRAVFDLTGWKTPQVLAKICALDLDESKFPDGSAAQTSLAKVRTLIVHLDNARTTAYYLIVDRSLALYVWEVVCDAAQEFGDPVLSQHTTDF